MFALILFIISPSQDHFLLVYQYGRASVVCFIHEHFCLSAHCSCWEMAILQFSEWYICHTWNWKVLLSGRNFFESPIPVAFERLSGAAPSLLMNGEDEGIIIRESFRQHDDSAMFVLACWPGGKVIGKSIGLLSLVSQKLMTKSRFLTASRL